MEYHDFDGNSKLVFDTNNNQHESFYVVIFFFDIATI